MRIVLDTNVLIAAALRGGFSEDILTALVTIETVSLTISHDIVEELSQKLEDKFNWSKSDINLFIEYISLISQKVEIREKVAVVKRDPDDNKILECAIASNADLIVSIDQDLIDLKEFRGIGIIHPKTLTWTFPEYFKKLKK